MPWSHPVLIQRVSAIATTMAILTTTSLKAQEESPQKDLFTATAVVTVSDESNSDDERKQAPKPTYEVKDGKITITAAEGTSPAELIQLIMREAGHNNKNVAMFEQRNDALRSGFPHPAIVEAQPRFVLGLDVAPVPEAVRSHLKLDHGLLVTTVIPEKPAAQAGIKPNDILVNVIAVPDQPVVELKAMTDLADQVTKSGEAGSEMTLTIIQDGEEENITLSPAKEDRPSFRVFMNSTTTAPMTYPAAPHDIEREKAMIRMLRERAAVLENSDELHRQQLNSIMVAPFPSMPPQAVTGFDVTDPLIVKSIEAKNAELQVTLEKLQAQQLELIKKMEELNRKLESK